MDSLYRILRYSEHCYHVVYITVNDLPIILPNKADRSDPRAILRMLRKHSEWDDHSWRTMDMSIKDHQVVIALDHEPVYGIHEHDLIPDLPRYDVFGFDKVIHLKLNTISRVNLEGKQFVIKIVPFSWQLRYIAQEIAIYNAFVNRPSTLMPKLIGYVYEEHPGRVIGFMVEALDGVHPGPHHRLQLREALRELHAQGVYHGDINNHNMIVTPSGQVVFIDLEASILATTDEEKGSLSGKMQEEMQTLEECPLEETAELAAPSVVHCPGADEEVDPPVDAEKTSTT